MLLAPQMNDHSKHFLVQNYLFFTIIKICKIMNTKALINFYLILVIIMTKETKNLILKKKNKINGYVRNIFLLWWCMDKIKLYKNFIVIIKLKHQINYYLFLNKYIEITCKKKWLVLYYWLLYYIRWSSIFSFFYFINM